MGDEELSVCVRLTSLGEAHALRQFLEEEQIPYRARPYQDTAFDGIGLAMHQQSGWGEVWVRVEDEARVKEAVKELRAAVAAEPPEAAPVEEPPEAPEERTRLSLHGLWLLILVLVTVVVVAIVSAVLDAKKPCEQLSDPLKREQCEEQRARAPQPGDWR